MIGLDKKNIDIIARDIHKRERHITHISTDHLYKNIP